MVASSSPLPTILFHMDWWSPLCRANRRTRIVGGDGDGVGDVVSSGVGDVVSGGVGGDKLGISLDIERYS